MCRDSRTTAPSFTTISNESFPLTFRNVTRRSASTREVTMLQLLIVIAAGIAGFILARNFVYRRLRFVDAVQSPFAPIIAGCLAMLIAWPVVLLPAVTLAAAVAFGIGTGLGTASGARAIRSGGGRHQLTP